MWSVRHISKSGLTHGIPGPGDFIAVTSSRSQREVWLRLRPPACGRLAVDVLPAEASLDAEMAAGNGMI